MSDRTKDDELYREMCRVVGKVVLNTININCRAQESRICIVGSVNI